MRTSAVTALVLLLPGALVAWALDGVLGLSFSPKTVPAEHFAAAPASAQAPPPRITAITGARSARVRLAAQAVADALVARGRPSPAVRAGAALALLGAALGIRRHAAGTGAAEATVPRSSPVA